jgi:CrcB protein
MLFIRYTILVGLGGAVGAIARYWLTEFTHLFFERGFPLGTMAVNVIGSLLMGFLATFLLYKATHSSELRSFLLIGMLGAFTTFSTFSLDTLNLLLTGKIAFAIINIILSIVLCIIAAGCGVYMALLGL